MYSELVKESLVTCHVVEEDGVGLEDMPRLSSEWHILDIDMETSERVRLVDGDVILIREEESTNWVLLTEELVMEETELSLRDILPLPVS